jgi:hypothetical protein
MNGGLVRSVLIVLLLTMQAAFAATPPAAPAAPEAPPFPPGRLAQLLAPVALYPDPLLAQILMAATYPLEVVEADRWLQDPGNAALSGDRLAAALQKLGWDPSVKALVAFPRILRMMDRDLGWTEALGDAVLAQQPAVMDAVQALRRQAQAAGSLGSNSKQSVDVVKGTVAIQPTTPQTVYVPQYDPGQVYGDWPWPNYLPDESWLEAWPDWGLGYPNEYPVPPYLWRWARLDWPLHQIDVSAARFNAIAAGRAPVASQVWQHNPVDRRGVAYRDAASIARFQGADAALREPAGSVAAAPEVLRGSSVAVLRGSTPTVAPAATARAGGFGPAAFSRSHPAQMFRRYRAAGFGGFAAAGGRGGGERRR